MKHLIIGKLCFTLLLACAFFVNAETLLQQVQAKIIQSQPFKVDFIQQVYIDSEKSLEESGVIIFVSRDHLKWEYRHPDFKIFILENKRYRFYDQENNQLLSGPIGQRNEQLIWDLLLAEKPGTVSSWDKRTRTIKVSLHEADGLQELKITIGKDFLPERVEQTAANEVKTIYLFTNYLSNIFVKPGEFALNLPADVEIIEE